MRIDKPRKGQGGRDHRQDQGEHYSGIFCHGRWEVGVGFTHRLQTRSRQAPERLFIIVLKAVPFEVAF